jgi:hypothetical protein
MKNTEKSYPINRTKSFVDFLEVLTRFIIRSLDFLTTMVVQIVCVAVSVVGDLTNKIPMRE